MFIYVICRANSSTNLLVSVGHGVRLTSYGCSVIKYNYMVIDFKTIPFRSVRISDEINGNLFLLEEAPRSVKISGEHTHTPA